MIIRENKHTTESSRPRSVYENLIDSPHTLCMPGYPPRHVCAADRRFLLTYLLTKTLSLRYAFYYRSFAPPARRAGRLFPFSRKGGNAHTLHRTPKHVHDVSAACPPHTAAMTAARMLATVDPRRPRAPDSMYFHHSWFPYDCLLCELCMYRLKKTLPRGGWQRSTGRYSDRKSSQSARKPNIASTSGVR